MSNVILVGMPACGKSTIGVILAKTLGMKFVDTDLLIQSNEGKLLQKIIDDEGLESFLEAEQRAILALDCKKTVIATGGSAVLCEQAVNHLKSIGKIIYINVDCNELERRLHNIETRGIACKKGETIREIYNVRKPFYEKYADIIIDTADNNIEKTVKNIIDKLK